MIEPAPSLCKPLLSLTNSSPIVEFEPVAIGSIPATLELFFDEEGSGFASLYQRDIRHVGVEMNHSVEVPVLTLDDLALKHNLSAIDFLKLDLEGHEFEALKGAKRLFQQNKIRAIAFEFGACNIDSRTYFKDFWQLLVYEYGFTMYRIAPGRKLISMQSYNESLERFSWQNILACAPGVKPEWKVIL
jgi:FkbM family methyltransferase